MRRGYTRIWTDERTTALRSKYLPRVVTDNSSSMIFFSPPPSLRGISFRNFDRVTSSIFSSIRSIQRSRGTRSIERAPINRSLRPSEFSGTFPRPTDRFLEENLASPTHAARHRSIHPVRTPRYTRAHICTYTISRLLVSLPRSPPPRPTVIDGAPRTLGQV